MCLDTRDIPDLSIRRSLSRPDKSAKSARQTSWTTRNSKRVSSRVAYRHREYFARKPAVYRKCPRNFDNRDSARSKNSTNFPLKSRSKSLKFSRFPNPIHRRNHQNPIVSIYTTSSRLNHRAKRSRRGFSPSLSRARDAKIRRRGDSAKFSVFPGRERGGPRRLSLRGGLNPPPRRAGGIS